MIKYSYIPIRITEAFESNMRKIAVKLGKKYFVPQKRNVSASIITPGKKAIDFFRSKHELEYKVFEFACRLNEESI